MSRSVSLHPLAVASVYLHVQSVVPDEWNDLLENVRDLLTHVFPSLHYCDRWEGHENNIILENRFAEVSIAEYSGLVSICLAPREDVGYKGTEYSLGEHWCCQVAKKFRAKLVDAYHEDVLIPMGTASNGEQFFTRASKPTLSESCITSKEGQLW